MNPIGNMAGEICRILLPIPDEVFFGNPASPIAVCTLSSMQLLRDLSKSEIMRKVAVVGRLLSENRGIDSLIRSVVRNPNLSTIILCGKDVRGHRAGGALLSLLRHGMDPDGRIANSSSPDPILAVSSEVRQFRRQISIIDRIGETDPREIIRLVG